MANTLNAGTVGDAVAAAIVCLGDKSDTPQLDCQILLAFVAGRDRAWIYAHCDDVLPAEQEAQFFSMVNRRSLGEPIAHLTQTRAFWNSDLLVSSDTLIPRPETECLIEAALEGINRAPEGSAYQVLELGTGTAAIALSLALEQPNWQITATDISTRALEIAVQNTASVTNINLIQSDWFQHVTGRFDLIVSNPPYLRDDDPHFETLAYEPRLALAAGPTGLQCLTDIIHLAPSFLKENSRLILEHGFDQRDDVMALLTAAGFQNLEMIDDLAGQPRLVVAHWLPSKELAGNTE